jgi:hypothetical protein
LPALGSVGIIFWLQVNSFSSILFPALLEVSPVSGSCCLVIFVTSNVDAYIYFLFQFISSCIILLWCSHIKESTFSGPVLSLFQEWIKLALSRGGFAP